MELIANYAKTHGMAIVRTFSDEGKSGITLHNRPGLRSLLSVVQSGLADFKAILVYDVSRWGRFQDIDESSYWEYVCKREKVLVHYCAEPFINDDSISSVIVKSLKRSMAAEYSRELSVKSFAGQCRLIELGYRQGGIVGYGLRRLLIDRENLPKQILSDGQQKSIHTDRVVFVEGNRIPLSIALTISRAEGPEMQRALSEAYESGELRGKRFKHAKCLIANRNSKWIDACESDEKPGLTGRALAREYQRRIREQEDFVKRASRIHEKLLLLKTAMKTLLADEHFLTLLRAEQLQDIPRELARDGALIE